MQKKFKKNVILAGIFTVLTLGSNFLLYRSSHLYLKDEESFGVWLTILSLITWIYIMDFGISNSLRNMLTNAIEKKDDIQIKKLISTTYTVMLIPLVIILYLGLTISFLDWSEIFNITEKKYEVNSLMKIILFLFPFVFYFNTISYIYHAYFKSYIVNIMQFLNLFINCVVIYILALSGVGDLVTMGIVYFSINIIIYLFFTMLFLFKKRLFILFNYKYFETKLIKPLLGTGVAFFILDIASIILYNSGPLLISYFFNPSYSVNFQLPYKLLNVFLTISTIFLTPLWTVMLSYYALKNIEAIKSINKKILKYLVIIILMVLISTIFVNQIIAIWIGEDFNIEYLFIFLVAIIVILSIVAHLFQTLLNSMNKIFIQVIVFSVAIVISISMMYFCVKVLDLGIYSFLLSLIIGIGIPSILLPIIFIRYISKTEGED